MLQSTQLFLACRDCGQIHSVSNRLPTDHWLLCRRCGRRLWRSPRGALDRSAAYVAAAMILFGSANGLTLFEITFVGDHRNGMIISGVIQLTRYSTGISGVGVLVALTSIIIPALTLALTFSVLARLISVGRDNPRFRPTLAAAWKLARHLRLWSMLDVYLPGAAVAYSRLRRLADVAIGAGGYALAPWFSSRSCSSNPSGARACGAPLATPRSTLPSRANRGFCAWVASSSPLLPLPAQAGAAIALGVVPVWFHADPAASRQRPRSLWRATSFTCRPMSCRC